jgi:hypothetical protein
VENTPLADGYTFGNLSDPKVTENLLNQFEKSEVTWKEMFKVCQKTVGEDLRYMGTSTVVRDIAFMTDVLEGVGADM